MKSHFRILLLFSIGLASASAQQDYSKVEIKTIPVAKNIYMLEGAGGNIGVSVGPDGILIVDDQFAPLAEKIEAALQKLNPGKLRFLLNTHFHGDHTGGNAHFGGKGADIVAHDNVRKRLASKSGVKPVELPVLTFKHSASVYFNGDEIELLHHGPGHTDGDSVIYFKGANVVHMGDQFVNGRFPFIDLGSGGDVRGYLKTVETVLKEIPADAKVIPGHGPLGTVEDLKKFRDMLTECFGMIEKAISEGKTLEQIKAAGVPEKYKDWGIGFINNSRWLEITYNGLTTK